MLRVLLVRHGLTHDNVAGITQGHSQGSLTPLGRAQAAALVRPWVCVQQPWLASTRMCCALALTRAVQGSRLAHARFGVVYCSDLGRCVETLELASAAASELEPGAWSLGPAPQYLPLLRERGAGVFEGTPLGTVDAAAAAAGVTTRAFRPDGGESWADVRARAAKFLLQCVPRAAAPCRRLTLRSQACFAHPTRI